MEEVIGIKGEETLSIKVTKYKCPKHGEHDAIMTMTFFAPTSNGSEIGYREKTEVIQYCMRCFQEMLDKNGVCRMEETE